jgi:pimeloyl-ACP methyl ester carboxylesterase
MWRGQIAGLSDRFTVIAPDLRGFGSSDATDGTVTMEQFADDLAALLVKLKISTPVAFCGLSMGGYIGWQFWKRHRDKLACLIACDTRAIADSVDAAHGRRVSAQNVLSGGMQELVGNMLPKLFSQATLAEQPNLVKATEQEMLAASKKGTAAALRGMAERPDVTEWLPQIDVPTLVICGSEDKIAPPEEMRGIASAIPNAQYAEISAAGHMAPLEQSEVVNEVIAEFLAGVFG